MSALFPDTQSEAEQVLIELLRARAGRPQAGDVGADERRPRMLALQGLRARHPDATEAQLQRYLADLLLGTELAARAYGPRPAEAPDAA